MNRIPPTLPEGLKAVLLGYSRATTFWRLALDLSITILLVGSFALACMLFDRFVDVAGKWRSPFPVIAYAALALCLIWTMVRLLRRPDYDRIALTLDRESGDHRDHLRTVLDFAGQESPTSFFAQSSQHRAIHRWQDASHNAYVKNARPRIAGAAAMLFAGLVVALWQVPDLRASLLLRRFLDPAGNYMRPSATWFRIEDPPDMPLRTGDDLLIRTRLMGREMGNPSPLLKVIYSDGSLVTRRLEPANGNLWKVELKNLRQHLDWFLFVQSARSERYTTQVLPRPTVVSTTVTYSYPKYTRMKSKTEVLRGRTIAALQGTKVKVKIRSNVDLATAIGATEEDMFRFRINRRNSREAILHLIINKNQKMKLDLLSHDDVKSKQDLPFNIRAIPDNIPSISIKNQLDGKSFFVTDILEIDYRAHDDLGLSEIFIRAQVPKERHPNSSPIIIDVDLKEYSARVEEGRIRLPVSDLLPVNADRLRVRLAARDTKDQEGSSRTVTLKIATDSFDRQLRFLLKTYKGQPHVHDHKRGEDSLSDHANLLAALKSARSKLAILIDSLDENDAVGENQEVFVKQMQDQLGRIGPGFAYGSYWFFDFQNAALPPRFRRLGEYAVCWSRLGLDGHKLREHFVQALKGANPKAELQKLVPILEKDIAQQANIERRVKEDHRAIVRELVGYLLSGLEINLARAGDESWNDPGFVAGVRETLKEIVIHIEAELNAECSEDALKALKDALNADEDRIGLKAIIPVLDQLIQIFSQKAREEIGRYKSDSSILRESLIGARSSSPGLVSPLGVGLYLGADNIIEDDVFLLQTAFRFLHNFSGRTEPFLPFGGSNESVRRREEAVFRLFQVLERARAQAEEFRLELVSQRFWLGQPEFDEHWLRLRERRFALLRNTAALAHLDANFRNSIAKLISSSEAFDAWHVPRDWTPARLAKELADFEQRSTKLSAPLLPGVKLLLEKIDRSLAARQVELKSAFEALRSDIRSEMVRLKKVKDPRSLGSIRTIKVRMKAVQIAVLKILDFAQLARIYHAGERVDLEPLLALNFLMSKAVQEFERTIESRSIHAFHHFRDHHLKAWLGKVREYEKMEKTLASLTQLLDSPGRPEINKLIEDQHLSHQYKQERKTIQAALSVQERLKDRKQLLSDLAGDGDDSSAAWAEFYYRLYMISDLLTSKGDTANLNELVTALQKMLKQYEQLPKELESAPEILTDCQRIAPDADLLEDLHRRCSSLLEESRPLVKVAEKHTMQFVREFYGWFQTIDVSALIRAKIRSQRQIEKDKRMVKRALAAGALKLAETHPAILQWTLGESELNRRKAAMTLDRVGLGGIALVGDNLDNLKLPKHLYLELKRSRGGAMPLLFKEECYDYLNRILKEARGE